MRCYNRALLAKKEYMMDKSFFMEEMKAAMKAGDKVKLGVVRFLMSEIKNVEIDAREPLTESDVLKILKRQVKQLKETIEGFVTAGRDDLAEEEKQKLVIVEAYLPAEMDDEKLRVIVEQVIKGMDSPNLGQVMKAVMQETSGSVDGGRVSALVRELL